MPRGCENVLPPGAGFDPVHLERTFTVQSADAVLPARDTDLVTLGAADWLPETFQALGLRGFPIPLELPPLELGMAWQPRNPADPAHRWFRAHLAAAVRQE